MLNSKSRVVRWDESNGNDPMRNGEGHSREMLFCHQLSGADAAVLRGHARCLVVGPTQGNVFFLCIAVATVLETWLGLGL